MSEDPQGPFAELLRRQAPAPRDPLFRVQVLERRERERFRRNAWLWAAAAAVLALAAAAGLSLRPQIVETLGVLVFGVGVSAVGILYAPALIQRVLRFRL